MRINSNNNQFSGGSIPDLNAVHSGGKILSSGIGANSNESAEIRQKREDANAALDVLREMGVQKIGKMVSEGANFHTSEFGELAGFSEAFNTKEEILGKALETSHTQHVARTNVDAMKMACRDYIENASDPIKAYGELKDALFRMSNSADGMEEPAVFGAMLMGFREYAIDAGHMKPGDYESIKLGLNARCFANEVATDAKVDVLGSGVFNSTYKVSIPDSNGVPATTRVAKAIMSESVADPSPQIGGVIIGGDSNRPLIAERNEAAARLDPFGVIVKSEVSYRVNNHGEGNRMLLMEMAPGKSVEGDLVPISIPKDSFQAPGVGPFATLQDAVDCLTTWDADGLIPYDENDPDQYKIMKFVASMLGGVDLKMVNGGIMLLAPTVNVMPFNNPDFRKKTVMLNFDDALTMQMDRHCGNYMVAVNADGSCTLKGIDNDASFPRTAFNTENLTFDDYTNKCWRGTHLPLVADKEIYDAFCDPVIGMTADSIQSQLEGLLPQEEIDATKTRLDLIQQHLQKLKADDKIIGMGGCQLRWGSLETAEILCVERNDTSTSYFGRDYFNSCQNIQTGSQGMDFSGQTVAFKADGSAPDELLLAEVP